MGFHVNSLNYVNDKNEDTIIVIFDKKQNRDARKRRRALQWRRR